ncbi:hypothetical protein [Streptomyces sp. NPDC057301]|uniref:hypothetical protein n=1 Tax=Streptomyces sp. NPDC057301 TaxID=3346093 RepID=UPI003626D48C
MAEAGRGGLRTEAAWLGRTGTGPGCLRLAARGPWAGLAGWLGVRVVLTERGPLRQPQDPAAITAAAQPIAGAAGADRGRAAALMSESEATAESCTVDPVRDLDVRWPHVPESSVMGAGPKAGSAVRLPCPSASSGRVDERSHGRSAVTPVAGR